MTKEAEYTKEDFINDMETALEEQPEQAKPARPNILEILKSKTGLNRIRNERV